MRFRRQLQYPTRPSTRFVGLRLTKVSEWFSKLRFDKTTASSQEAWAVYHLNANPVTFDFVDFLIAAESFFLGCGSRKFNLVVVMRDEFQERRLGQIASTFSPETEKWRLLNIVLPAAHMWSSVLNVMLIEPNRARTFLRGLNLRFPPGSKENFFPSWDHVSVFTSDLVDEFVGLVPPEWGVDRIQAMFSARAAGQPLVTITLRDRPFDESRNVDMREVQIFQDWAQETGIDVILVPDTESDAALGVGTSEETFAPAAWNLYLRTALYASADLNFYLSNGPGTLALACREVSGILFVPILEQSRFSTEEHIRKQGLNPDEGRHTWDAGRFTYVFGPMTARNLIRETSEFFSSNQPVTCE